MWGRFLCCHVAEVLRVGWACLRVLRRPADGGCECMAGGVYLKSTEMFLRSAFRQKCRRCALNANAHHRLCTQEVTKLESKDDQRRALQMLCKNEWTKQHQMCLLQVCWSHIYTSLTFFYFIDIENISPQKYWGNKRKTVFETPSSVRTGHGFLKCLLVIPPLAHSGCTRSWGGVSGD